MNWSWLDWAYTASLTLGTGYTVIAFFLGHFGGDHGGGGHDAGGHDFGGADGDVGGNAGHVSVDNAMHFPLLSPVVIAMFFTAFGAGGLIGIEVLKDRHPLMTLLPAIGGGLAFGGLLGWTMMMFFRRAMGTSQARESDIIGAEAQVTVTIPPAGVGKIAYEAAGTRFTAPARSAAGTEIRQDAKVVIRKRDGAVMLVDSL